MLYFEGLQGLIVMLGNFAHSKWISAACAHVQTNGSHNGFFTSTALLSVLLYTCPLLLVQGHGLMPLHCCAYQAYCCFQVGRYHQPKSPGAVFVLLAGHQAQLTLLIAACACPVTMLRTQTALPACPVLGALTAAPGAPASAHTALLAPTLPLR